MDMAMQIHHTFSLQKKVWEDAEKGIICGIWKDADLCLPHHPCPLLC